MNVSGLNTISFPTLSAYLNALPSGFESFPMAKTRGYYSLALREELKRDISAAPLPQVIRARFLAAWGADDWIPAVIFAALTAFAKDYSWKTDAAFDQGMVKIASGMYQSPFYRGLMAIVSPSLMVMGAARRWGTFHQGTQLRVTNQTKTSGDADLTFPDHLFCRAAVHSLGVTLATALAGCGAKDVELTLLNLDKGKATLRYEWNF